MFAFRPKSRVVPADLPAFAGLPVRRFTVGAANEQMAVHVAGRLDIGRVPLVCVPGLQRNMSDFADFVGSFHRALGEDWPVVLLDLKGRGRSSDRTHGGDYLSTRDAEDLIQLVAALALDGGIFVGEGYGGQVVMALAALRPTLIAGTVLIDAGPLSDPRGLVRLRNNLRHLAGPRSAAGYRSMFQRMLLADYPAAPPGLLERLSGRTHFLDARGHVQPLFDPEALKFLAEVELDDVLVPQWPLFAALNHAPLLLLRTALTEQLTAATFDEMMRRRPDAPAFIIDHQGSPALLASIEDATPIADFVRPLVKRKPRAA